MTPAPQEEDASDAFDRVVAAFNKQKVEFMIIGGWAVAYHGHVRETEDLDLFIRPTLENAKRAVAALEAVGGSCPELKPEVFTDDNGISLGEAPVRIDVLSRLPGVDFDQAWPRSESSSFGAEMVRYICREDLIKNKRAVARPKDLNDALELEAGRNRPSPP